VQSALKRTAVSAKQRAADTARRQGASGVSSPGGTRERERERDNEMHRAADDLFYRTFLRLLPRLACINKGCATVSVSLLLCYVSTSGSPPPALYVPLLVLPSGSTLFQSFRAQRKDGKVLAALTSTLSLCTGASLSQAPSSSLSLAPLASLAKGCVGGNPVPQEILCQGGVAGICALCAVPGPSVSLPAL
ncbi:hypothetical protein KIPB_011582, partial [Kipferlia bialata]